jgi:PAS domain S-box-containing protein
VTNRPIDLSRDDLPADFLVGAIADYAIYMLDRQGFIVSWNLGAEKIKGFSRDEILGQHFSRFFTPEDQAAKVPQKILDEARIEGRYESEGWRVRKDGRRFWANAILQALKDERGNLVGFAKITRDMSERLRAQQALQESERRFRMLVDGVIDYAIYMLDPSGLIVNWNSGAERLKGYDAEEIVGHHFSKFYTPEDRARGLPARVLATATTEGRYEGEGWRVRKDGSRFWASVVVDAIRNERGELEGFAKVTRDITERRAAQESVRESERQFRLLMAGVTDYALYMLDPNGVITSWNAGAERIKGYMADEIIGQHFSRFYTERDRAAGAPARALYTALHEGRFEAEAWRVRKDGSLFWANVVIDPVRDEKGQLVGFAKITRDITERREASLALQEAQSQRAHAEKMDALGQLTGGVAHDFNNLLMIILGQVSRLKKLVPPDPAAGNAIEAIDAATRRGATLTRQLLTFSRRQTFQPTVIEVGKQLQSIQPLLLSCAGSAAKLTITAEPSLWRIQVDQSEFELAIVNLVVNARDAVPEGGFITVTAENMRLTGSETDEKLTGEFVALRVSDTGSGIPADVLPKVFDPFFTTKQPGKGTGLGLSQVYGFVKQSGGTVSIRSDLGAGTTVTLWFPRSQDKPAGKQAEAEPAVAGEGRVLVVEDNPEVAEVTSWMLKELGYELVIAQNAEEAIRLSEENEVDLVVTDIVMAGSMDGVKLARTLRERRPHVPVLLVTGYSRKAMEVGAEFAVLRKPFEITDLSRLAARLIAASRQSPKSNVVRLRDATKHRG